MQNWSGKKILIVDDAALPREMLKRAYSDIGLNIVGFAFSGVEAIEKVQALKPDVISLDVIMPDMHGIDCFRQLRAADSAARIVLCTCLELEKLALAYPDEIAPEQMVHKPPQDNELSHALSFLFNKA